MKVVFDLDGTLANNIDRQHLARVAAKAKDADKEKAWNDFHDGIPHDPPIMAVLRTLQALHSVGHNIEIWTARPERYRTQTLEWLHRHDIPFQTLKMRKDDEGRVPAVTIKTRWYDEEQFQKPVMIFEDHPGVVAAFRERGVIAAQVGEEPSKSSHRSASHCLGRPQCSCRWPVRGASPPASGSRASRSGSGRPITRTSGACSVWHSSMPGSGLTD